MPPRRKSRRKRRASDSPEPLLSLRPSPTPPPEDTRAPSLTPPPALPPPEALSNLDIIRNILLHADAATVKNAFTVSTSFYMAAGPLLYRHITIGKADTVLKILNLVDPPRRTRGHAKKTMTPLPFLSQTVSISLGFHLGEALPKDWMSKLKRVLPSVQRMRMLQGSCWGGCRRLGCQDKMWELGATLGVEHASLDMQLRSKRGGPWDVEWAPKGSLPTQAPKVLSMVLRETVIGSYPTLGHTESMMAMEFVKPVSTLRLVIGRLINPMILVCFYSPRTLELNPEHRKLEERRHRDQWSDHCPSIKQIAEGLFKIVTSNIANWIIYHLDDVFPKESTHWPDYVKTKFVPAQESISDLLAAMIDAKYPDPASPRPSVQLRTRADYLREGAFELSPTEVAALQVLEAKTSESHQGATGLFGTWDLALKA